MDMTREAILNQFETLPCGMRSLSSELRSQIGLARAAVQARRAEYERALGLLTVLEHELALRRCPFRAGDMIYLGPRGYKVFERAELIAILPPGEDDPGEYAVEAFAVKKDGTRTDITIPRRFLDPVQLEGCNADLVAARKRGDVIPRIQLRG